MPKLASVLQVLVEKQKIQQKEEKEKRIKKNTRILCQKGLRLVQLKSL